MSEIWIDEKGWHAAKLAYPSITGEQEIALARAIRAYEAHKASAVPDRDRINQHIGNPGVVPND